MSRQREVEVVVDARGLRCPLPVLHLARALDGLPAGAQVRLLATDPAARVDVAAFARMRGLELLEAVDVPAPEAWTPEASPPEASTPEASTPAASAQQGSTPTATSEGAAGGGHTAYLVRVSATAAGAAR